MKRYIALFSILVVFASLLVGCDINRMGKDEYYVQIKTDGIEKNEKLMVVSHSNHLSISYLHLIKKVKRKN